MSMSMCIFETAMAVFAMQVCLMGRGDEFVVSGSDDGRVFIWDQNTTRLVNMLTSEDHTMQCVAPHPSLPVLASAGSEPVVKLWSPQVSITLVEKEKGRKSCSSASRTSASSSLTCC